MVMLYCTYTYNVCHMWYVLQVLSEMIAKVLESDGHAETAQFVNYFDKFFDCLNVASITGGKIKRKTNCYPYHCGNDDRLTVINFTIDIQFYYVSNG